MCVCMCTFWVYMCTHTPISVQLSKCLYQCVCVCMHEWVSVHVCVWCVYVVCASAVSLYGHSSLIIPVRAAPHLCLVSNPIMPGSNHIIPLINWMGKSYKVTTIHSTQLPSTTKLIPRQGDTLQWADYFPNARNLSPYPRPYKYVYVHNTLSHIQYSTEIFS